MYVSFLISIQYITVFNKNDYYCISPYTNAFAAREVLIVLEMMMMMMVLVDFV